MRDIIKRRTTNLYNQKNVKKYTITHKGLQKIIRLRPRTQELLLDILNLIGNTSDLDSVVLNLSFEELGFKDRSNFSKYKKELIDDKLLFQRGREYYVNPCYVNYYTRRQQDFFFNLFGLIKTKNVIMTDPKFLIGAE